MQHRWNSCLYRVARNSAAFFLLLQVNASNQKKRRLLIPFMVRGMFDTWCWPLGCQEWFRQTTESHEESDQMIRTLSQTSSGALLPFFVRGFKLTKSAGPCRFFPAADPLGFLRKTEIEEQELQARLQRQSGEPRSRMGGSQNECGFGG